MLVLLVCFEGNIILLIYVCYLIVYFKIILYCLFCFMLFYIFVVMKYNLMLLRCLFYFMFCKEFFMICSGI